jgi:hypothetical protein
LFEIWRLTLILLVSLKFTPTKKKKEIMNLCCGEGKKNQEFTDNIALEHKPITSRLALWRGQNPLKMKGHNSKHQLLLCFWVSPSINLKYRERERGRLVGEIAK